MATLTKDPISGAYIVKQGDTLSKIAQTQGVTLAELLATNPSYASNPNLIKPGQTVNTPSYSNLTSSTPTTTNNAYVPPALQQTDSSVSPEVLSFTDALVKILKEAQGRNITGQAKLMGQSNKIVGQGITDATSVFKNKKLAPDSGTSLARSATSAFDPSLLSIADQQKLATQGMGDITDLVKVTQDSYEKEQDRIQRAKEHAETLAASAAKKEASFDSDVELPKFITDFESATGEDGYVAPEEWIAARTLWGLRGGSDSSFVSNFKRYLNPASYSKAGINSSSVSADWGA